MAKGVNLDLPDTMTLREARDALRAVIRKGARCPCCRRWARVNPYTIGHTATRALIVLVRLFEKHQRWIRSKEIAAFIAGVPVEKLLACTGDGLTKLSHWELVEAKPNTDDETKRDSGFWRPTQKAVEFVYGRIRLPRWAEVYDNRLLRLNATETVSVTDTLGTTFNYAELMATVASTAPALHGGAPPA